MTEQMFRSVARCPAWLRARPPALLSPSLLAYAAGMWMQFLHRAEGGHERNEPGFLLHWLRDGTLSLPLVLLLVWLGLAVARRLIGDRAESDRRLALMVCAACVGLAAGLSAAIGGPAHGALFPASHGGHELPLLLHAGRDALLSLAVSLPLAAVTAPRARAPHPVGRARPEPLAPADHPRPAPRRARRGRARGRRPVRARRLQQRADRHRRARRRRAVPRRRPRQALRRRRRSTSTSRSTASATTTPTARCTSSPSDVAAVRAQEASRQVSLGLRDDAIQPLVIRANLGDCVEIDYHQQRDAAASTACTSTASPSHAASSGDAIGDNVASSVVARGARRAPTATTCPSDKELEGTHYIRPGPGYRQAGRARPVRRPRRRARRARSTCTPTPAQPLRSGWEAIDQAATARPPSAST